MSKYSKRINIFSSKSEDIGCEFLKTTLGKTNVEKIPVSKGERERTPDFKFDGGYCEVKSKFPSPKIVKHMSYEKFEGNLTEPFNPKGVNRVLQKAVSEATNQLNTYITRINDTINNELIIFILFTPNQLTLTTDELAKINLNKPEKITTIFVQVGYLPQALLVF